MKIKKLKVSSFRNLESGELQPGEGVNILYGPNGSGKTNLLEAIFMLSLGRSQRGANDGNMIFEGHDVYRLEGTIDTMSRSHKVAVAYSRQAKKKITIEGVSSKTSDLYDFSCVVSSGPEDSDILSGPPSVRRVFLDMYISQISRKYLSDLTDYSRALAQKNSALKQRMDCGMFDAILITAGSRVMEARRDFLLKLKERASEHYKMISNKELFSLNYKPSVSIDEELLSVNEIEAVFQIKLEDNYERERIMQTAMVGPHRDEIQFDIGGRAARIFGSQGQWRTAALAIKLAVYDILKDARGSNPVLLLDEIFAELDKDRCSALIKSFADFSQVFLTTALEPPDELKEAGRSFKVENGQVTVSL